jgi:hypothetical protein
LERLAIGAPAAGQQNHGRACSNGYDLGHEECFGSTHKVETSVRSGTAVARAQAGVPVSTGWCCAAGGW